MESTHSQHSQSENKKSDNKNIAEELESVNEARLHTKEIDTHTDDEEDTVDPEQRLKEALEEANNKYLRLYAEFDNYKKRTSKERIEMLQAAGKDVIADLLPILDDLDRALKAMEATEASEATREGVSLVANKLKGTLQQKGLKEMESLHQPFDADLHEAVTNIPAPSDALKGKVVDEIVKGYLLNGKVLRYAKVVVGS